MIDGLDIILQAASEFTKEANKLEENELTDLLGKLGPAKKYHRHNFTKKPEAHSPEEVAAEVKSGVYDGLSGGLEYTIRLLSQMLVKAKPGKDKESLLRTIGFLRRVKGSV